MSQPWIKFYPRDWRGDQALRAVSIAARGLWLECLCIMHEAKPYGHLLLNGDPVEGDTLARMTGVPVAEVQPLMAELHKAGVLSVTNKGVVFSRRMTKDHARAQKGRLSAKRRWQQASEDVEQSEAPNRYPSRVPITQKPEARSQREKKECTNDDENWLRFKTSFPRREGGNPWKPAREKFDRAVKRGAEPAAIVAGAEAYRKQCEADGSIGTKFVAQAMTWLNQERWNDEYVAAGKSTGKSQAELDALYAILDAPSPRRDSGDVRGQGEGFHPGER